MTAVSDILADDLSVFFSRKVCETVLSSPGLQFINATVWQQSFTFVSQLLQQMDYKVDLSLWLMDLMVWCC